MVPFPFWPRGPFEVFVLPGGFCLFYFLPLFCVLLSSSLSSPPLSSIPFSLLFPSFFLNLCFCNLGFTFSGLSNPSDNSKSPLGHHHAVPRQTVSNPVNGHPSVQRTLARSVYVLLCFLLSHLSGPYCPAQLDSSLMRIYL